MIAPGHTYSSRHHGPSSGAGTARPKKNLALYSSPARALPALLRLPGRWRCAPPPLGRCLVDEYLPLACGPVRRCRGTHCIRDIPVACAAPDAPPPRTMLSRGCCSASLDDAAPPAPGCCSCLLPLRFRRPRLPVGSAPFPPAGCRASPAPTPANSSGIGFCAAVCSCSRSCHLAVDPPSLDSRFF